jgi:hypothetical protein
VVIFISIVASITMAISPTPMTRRTEPMNTVVKLQRR